MAEVANMPAPTAAAGAPPPTGTIADKTSSQNDNYDEDKISSNAKDSRLNSHHHDSEYDTASDDGGDDDDYDDEDDESLGADGEEDESENGSIGFDSERQRGDGQEQSEFSKKVDEDRSNPQYIPKKGIFYEHDDRTLDEPGGTEGKTDEAGDGDQTKSSTPNNSQASKTMKKWQQASAVDRWSHDRYEESEQAPKSRQELVSAYGYDIRSEDGPPRPRRRRRYGRGPNKYIRNWEDESAYIKSTANPQRKPRPEDFPALGGDRDRDPDRKMAPRKSRSFREEKENRYNRDGERTSTTFNRGTNLTQRDGRIDKRNASGKSFRSGRPTLEFKNQNRNRFLNESQQSMISSSGGRKVDPRDDPDHVDTKAQLETVVVNSKLHSKQVPLLNKHLTGDDMPVVQIDCRNYVPNQLVPGAGDAVEKIQSTVVNSRQIIPTQAQLTAQLQLQNRSDPSHVGSVQMHSIMSQNPTNLTMPPPPQQHQQQQQPPPQSQSQQPPSEANRTKRYSSLRQRSQNDTIPAGPQPTIVDQHTLAQQIQLHDHLQAHPTQQHVILQDQHLLQANLMQLYHTQENLQAQMQGVTIPGLNAASHQPKPQYQNVQAQYQAAAPSPAYYAPAATEYTQQPQQVPPPQPQSVVPSQYPPPTAAAAYIQQSQPPPPSANPMAAYSPQPQATGAAPTAIGYVQNPTAPGPASYPNYPNLSGYQNFNTVGGTTYFVPQQSPAPRPVVLPQRRPTNAIPILAPPNDKKGLRINEKQDDDSTGNKGGSTTLDSADNIDHILDNMFVQRPPYQPPVRKSSSPSNTIETAEITAVKTFGEEKILRTTSSTAISTTTELNAGDARLEEAVKSMTLNDEQKPIEQNQQTTVTASQSVVTAVPVDSTATPMPTPSSTLEPTAAETG